MGGTDRGSKLRVFCIDRGCFAGDLHHFTRLTEFHAEIDTLASPCIQRQVGIRASLEALGLSADFVRSDGQLSYNEKTALIGSSCDRQIGSHVGHSHLGIGDGGPRWVSHGARELAILDLRHCAGCQNQH